MRVEGSIDGSGARRALRAALFLGGAMAAAQAGAFDISVRSERPGHLFTDSDAIEMDVGVQGVTAPATVEYRVSETSGPWTASG